MERLLRRAAWLVAPVFVFVAAAGPTAAVDPVVTQNAVEYLRTQQNPGTDPATGSGAWDTSPEFEFTTTEAVLAIAEGAQAGSSWSTGEAHAAVQTAVNADDVNPLPFVDLMATDPVAVGRAAKLVLLVAAPLGLDPEAFDPAGDGSPVDLAAAIGDPNPDGSFGPPGFFNTTLYAALAKWLVDGAVPAATVDYIRSAQKPGGGWSFDGDPDDAGFPAEVDTTSFAVQALIAGGADPTDAAVQQGLAFMAPEQNADGSWSAFGAVSAEATSRALLAIAAAGYDPNSSCWRDTVLPELAGTPYGSPDDALAGLQAADGSIAGPGSFDASFSTAQAVQGLERNWLPIARGEAQACSPATPAGGTAASPDETPQAAEAAPAGAVAASPRFTG